MSKKESVDSQEAIKVCVRVRPFNPREIEIHEEANKNKTEWDRRPLRAVVAFDGGKCTFHSEAGDDVGQAGGQAVSNIYDRTERFIFDKCYWSIPDEVETCPNGFASQETVFQGSGVPLLEQAFAGFNSCLFAFGQTGAGKSFSMSGGSDAESAGIIPRVAKRLFEMAKEKTELYERQSEEAKAAVEAGDANAPHQKSFSIQVTIRYLEIYSENVKDLLWSLNTLSPEQKAKTNPENLKVRSSPATGVFVENLTGVVVESAEQMLDLIEQGNSSRTVAATKMNERSSRSHAIFKIEVRQITQVHSGKQFEKPTEHIRDAAINLVDLAGSERNKKTGATGDRLKEAASINKSLSCLKLVIDTLVENSNSKNKKKPPYRDSTLTSLLMDSLGGNSKTFMLVCISPHSDNAEETLQTLRYGSKARQIVTTVHVNENAAGRLLLDMEDQLAKLRDANNQVSFGQTAEGHAKMELMKSDIEEKSTLVSVLESQLKKAETSTSTMKTELRKIQNENFNNSGANIRKAQDSKSRRNVENAKRWQECEARYNACRNELKQTKEHLAEGEFTVEQVENQIEANRAALDNTEVEVDILRRRNAKLDLSRRELVRSVSEQETQLNQLFHTRMINILTAKARSIRLRVEQKHFLKDMERKHEQSRIDLVEQHRKNVSNEKATTDVMVRELKTRIEDLERKHTLQRAAAEKVESERAMQVEHLENDLAALRREKERLTALGTKRLDRSKTEWDARDERGRHKMEMTLRQLKDQFSEEHARTVGHQREVEAKRQEHWKEDMEQVDEKAKKMIEDAHEDGEMKMKKIDDELGPILNLEREKLEHIISELKDLLEEEDEYANLSHALTTIWRQFPILGQAEEFWEKMAAAAAHVDENSNNNNSPSSKNNNRNSSPASERGTSVYSTSNTTTGGAAAGPGPGASQSRSASTASALSSPNNAGNNNNFNNMLSSLPNLSSSSNNGGNNNKSMSSTTQSRSSSAAPPGGLNATTTTTASALGASSSPNRWSQMPKSFFTRLVEFLRSRERNQPSRYQLQQIIHTAERVVEGAWKDISSVEQPVKL